jgi:hypothetical protein
MRATRHHDRTASPDTTDDKTPAPPTERPQARPRPTHPAWSCAPGAHEDDRAPTWTHAVTTRIPFPTPPYQEVGQPFPASSTENKSHSPRPQVLARSSTPRRGRVEERTGGPPRVGEKAGGKETARRNQGARLAQSRAVRRAWKTLCLFDPLTARGTHTYIGASGRSPSGSWPHRSRHEHYDGWWVRSKKRASNGVGSYTDRASAPDAAAGTSRRIRRQRRPPIRSPRVRSRWTFPTPSHHEAHEVRRAGGGSRV